MLLEEIDWDDVYYLCWGIESFQGVKPQKMARGEDTKHELVFVWLIKNKEDFDLTGSAIALSVCL